MNLYLILILLASPANNVCTTTALSAPESPAATGSGWWLTQSCVWEQRPCPGFGLSTGSDALVQRLPMGCKALQPSIAYTPAADLKIRKEFAEANAKIKALKSELKLSRENLMKINDKTVDLVDKSSAALSTCIDTAQLQHRALEQSERQIFWTRLAVATTAVAILSAGIYGVVIWN